MSVLPFTLLLVLLLWGKSIQECYRHTELTFSLPGNGRDWKELKVQVYPPALNTATDERSGVSLRIDAAANDLDFAAGIHSNGRIHAFCQSGHRLKSPLQAVSNAPTQQNRAPVSAAPVQTPYDITITNANGNLAAVVLRGAQVVSDRDTCNHKSLQSSNTFTILVDTDRRTAPNCDTEYITDVSFPTVVVANGSEVMLEVDQPHVKRIDRGYRITQCMPTDCVREV
ncbi:hypothetical protein RI367_008312 [Sorochytrium milnesiophthora]